MGSPLPSDPIALPCFYELFFPSPGCSPPYHYCHSLRPVFSPRLPNNTSHSTILFIAWDGWRCYDYFLISLVWMGSNLIISDKKMLYNGIGNGSNLQKIARRRYSPRQYRVVENIRCPRQAHSRSSHNSIGMGFFLIHSRRDRPILVFRLKLGLKECSD